MADTLFNVLETTVKTVFGELTKVNYIYFMF